jgi:uncharacterized protein
MLRNTFCHIPHVTPKVEQNFWDAGIHTWAQALRHKPESLPCRAASEAVRHLALSTKKLEQCDPTFFADTLPSHEHWRLFPDFRSSIAYLDIETTGLSGNYDHVTTIALYDGESVHHYVKGKNLGDFKRDIRKYGMIVSFNGKTFDVPFLRNSLNISIDVPHIDLRYVLAQLGYTGGLKACERTLGISRKGMKEIDGVFAVLLWEEYARSKDKHALETLLAYNITDVLNLELLMVIAYNKLIHETPFAGQLTIGTPCQPDNPFEVHRPTVRRLLNK